MNDCFQARSGYSVHQKANGKKRPEADIKLSEFPLKLVLKSILNTAAGCAAQFRCSQGHSCVACNWLSSGFRQKKLQHLY
jgi:hypothetical protein